MTPQLARLDLRTAGRALVAEVTGEIDMSNAADLSAAMSARVTQDIAALVIDLTGVTYLDSAAIHVIYEMREQLAARGLQLHLVVPDGAPTTMALRLTGVLDALPVHVTAAEAEAVVG